MLTFTEFLTEGRGFELGGSKYSSGFGRYTKDGKSISKEEYMKASAEYKGEKPSSSNTSTNAKADGEEKEPKRSIIPAKDYHTTGGFPGGSQYDIRHQTMEVSYPHRDGVYPAGHTALKYNYNKDSKILYKFYKSNAEKNNKEVTKEDFMDYALKTLWDNIEHTVNQYGDKHAKFDVRGIQSKVTDVFRAYIDDNFDKISKAK